MCQHWGAGDPSESTQVHAGRGIWVRKLFWALLKPLRMRCSTFCGLDEQVGAGEKKCTRPPHTQPTTWTSSALKTCQVCLLGLTFRLLVSGLHWLPCLLAQKGISLWRYSFSLHHARVCFCHRCSRNKVSLCFRALSIVDLTPEFHSVCAAGCVVLLPWWSLPFCQMESSSFRPRPKQQSWESGKNSLSSHPSPCCVTRHSRLKSLS